MEFGIFPCTEDPPRGEHVDRLFDEIVAEAQAAEAAGFDSFLFTEHHQVPNGYFPSPLLLSAAIAAKTQRIKVGSCIILLPLYHPVRVAEDGALLDILSKGRLCLGVGAGVAPKDFEAFGVPRHHRGAMTEEAIEVIRRAWTEERFTHLGRYFRLKEVSVTPRPLQKPHPPIWVAGMVGEAVKRAARRGDGWFIDVISNLTTLKRLSALYQETCRVYGKRPYIVALRDAWVAESSEAADREYGPYVADSHRFYHQIGAYDPALDPWVKDLKPGGEFPLQVAKRDRFILGSAKDCIGQIERWRAEVGIDHFVLRFRHPTGPPHAKVLEAIGRFGETVIPHFRKGA